MVEQTHEHRRLLRGRPPVALSGAAAVRDAVQHNLSVRRMIILGARLELSSDERVDMDIHHEVAEVLYLRVRANTLVMRLYSRCMRGTDLLGDDSPDLRSALRSLATNYPRCERHYRRLRKASRNLHKLLVRTELSLAATVRRT